LDHTLTIVFGIIGIVVTVAIPLGGYFITTLRNSIDSTEKLAKERTDNAAQAVRDSESRLLERIREAERRAEQGDERVLQHVNSQFAEVNAQLRELRDDVKELVRSSRP
jgi:predicted PurR-regulated permease PerM